MVHKNERQLILILRYTLPLLIMILSIAINAFLFYKQDSDFKKIENDIEKKYILNQKENIKIQIENIYNYIISEQKETEKKLKQSLINRTIEAHTIITNIYEEYKDSLSKEEMIPIFKAAIKDIRFNNKRGYFFVYDNKGTNIIHPLLPKLEGKNLINYQDTKGLYVLKESIELLKNKDSAYQEWHWRKTKDDSNEYKKIGFVKNIYQLDWFIGTGEYVNDFSKDMEKNVLKQIEKLRFGKNSYFLAIDKNNKYISHINKNLIGENFFNKLNAINNVEKVNKIKKTIASKEGYINLDFYKPNSKRISSKIMYLKIIPMWDWIISTGFYKEDVKNLIEEENHRLINKYNENLENLITISLLTTFILLIISFYISTLIEKKFKKYKIDIEHHLNENKKQVELLAQKNKLTAMGEMMGNIAHQWRQPLSLITTTTSGIKLQKDLNILDDHFLEMGLENIKNSALHLSQTIEDFRDFFKPDKKKKTFLIETLVEKTFKLISSEFKDKEITIIKNINNITITNFERELLQVLLNVLSNARDALLINEKLINQKKLIFIDAYEEKEQVIILIKDNAGGIKKDVINRVFEPYFTTKHQSQGTGIGLYMSQEIISKHMQGIITVTNDTYDYEGKTYKGASFKILIPKAPILQNQLSTS